MVTISAFRWVPDFARGNVRDFRVRWMMEEAGLAYDTQLIGMEEKEGAVYRAQQPFAQVPATSWQGESWFESGAIVLLIAERTGVLMPADPVLRARVTCWMFAALNSVEPPLSNVAEVDYFMEDEAQKAMRRPVVVEAANLRLGQLQAALDGRDYLVGDDFTVADLLMASVLRVPEDEALAPFPALAAYRARCLGRPAFERAIAAQLADFARCVAERAHA